MSQAPVFKYYVWGQVRAPGAYPLGANPDIVELISAANGPTEYADVSHIIIFRAVTGKRLKVDLKQVLARGDVVSLSPGDVVTVPNSPWYSIRYALSVASTIVSFATLTMTVLIYTGVATR
jgi:protein involved in polysaccharide export with SLBB domain